MAWQDSDQIDNSEWEAATTFFSADKGAEIYQGKHFFIRTGDGQIYGINEQDSQLIQANLNHKKQWPPALEVKTKENQLVNLQLISSLLKIEYKVAPTGEAAAAPKSGWMGKLDSLKQMAEQTVDKAGAQISKATSEVSKAGTAMVQDAEKTSWKDKLTGLKDKATQTGWKDKFTDLKDKAEAQMSKASGELGKAGAKLGAVAKTAESKVSGPPGLAAIKGLQNQAEHFEKAAKAIREITVNPEHAEEYKAIADTIDTMVQKLKALTPPSNAPKP